MNRPISFFATALLATAAQATYVSINDEAAYNQHVLQNSKCCIVKFAAEWCGTCKEVKEPFEQISQEPEFAEITFAHVNIDQAQDLTKKQGIVGVPTFFYVAQGNKVDQEVGVQDMNGFKENMRNNIRKNFQGKQNGQSVEAPASAQPEAVVVVAEPQEKEAGIFDTVINIIKRIVDAIIGLIKYVVDAVKGLFGR